MAGKQKLISLCLHSGWVIFVGEPTGTRPNFIAEGNMFQLPYSGMYASVSNNYWQGGFNSNDSRKWIAPELGAEPNYEDYANNIDPAMKVILNYLKNYQKQSNPRILKIQSFLDFPSVSTFYLAHHKIKSRLIHFFYSPPVPESLL